MSILQAIASKPERLFNLDFGTVVLELVFPRKQDSSLDTQTFKADHSMILDKIAAYPANWDGPESKKIDPDSIKIARELISKFSQNPKMIPGYNGNLFLVFSKDNGDTLEIDIRGKDLFVYQSIGEREVEEKVDHVAVLAMVAEFNG